MLIYDRHNLIYAYGHLEEWKTLLKQMGLTEVSSASTEIPDPHSHHYHAISDDEESRLLNYWEWLQTPLLEQDTRERSRPSFEIAVQKAFS